MVTTQSIVLAALFSIVLVFNAAGNSLVIYIISTNKVRKSVTNYLLLNMAVADLIVGIFAAPGYIVQPFIRHPSGRDGDLMCKLNSGEHIASIASEASLVTMVTLSVERFYAVCLPHKFQQTFTIKRAKILMAISWVHAMLTHTPFVIFSY